MYFSAAAFPYPTEPYQLADQTCDCIESLSLIAYADPKLEPISKLA